MDFTHLHTSSYSHPFIFVFFSAGYVVFSLKLKCSDCIQFLTHQGPTTTQDDTSLISIKNRGGLKLSNPIVSKLCLMNEHILRQILSVEGLSPNTYKKALSLVMSYAVSHDLIQHFTCASHASSLLKTLVSRYCTIRIHHETKKASSDQSNIRQKLNILFSHV